MVVYGVLARLVRPLHFPGVDYVPGAIVLFLGFLIAVFSGDPEWFRRFGAILIAFVLYLAAGTFYLKKQYEAFREQIQNYFIKIHGLDVNDLIETRYGERRYRLNLSSGAEFALVRAGELGMYPNMLSIDITFTGPDEHLFYIRPDDFEKFRKLVLDVLKRELDEAFRLELIYALVGTFVVAFGDLILFWL